MSRTTNITMIPFVRRLTMNGLHGVVGRIQQTQMEMIMKHWIGIENLIKGYFFSVISSQNKYFFCSICENPKDIDARVIKTRTDWRYIDSVLINAEIGQKWNIGISRYG